jgi:undecaprenyl-diphosphatase
MTLPRHLTPRIFGCLSLFAGTSVLMTTGATQTADVAVLTAVGAARTPGLVDAMLGVSLLNEGAVPVVAALGFALLLFRVAGRWLAFTYVAAVVSGELLYLIAKASFHRPRPEVITKLAGAGWVSYPSGHTMMAPIIWSLGFLLLARYYPRARRPLALAALLIPFLIAASRVVLGVHYLTDVVAALALGGAWLFGWLDVIERRPVVAGP